MTTIIHTNDWHFASKNPVSRTDDYNAELFALLDQLHALVHHFKADALCHAGDIFHDKSKAPWPVVTKLLEWGRLITRQYCPILIIPGNHDLTHDRYDSRGETPIGALIGSGIFWDISRTVTPLGLSLPTFYGVPWPDGTQPLAVGDIPEGVDIVLVHGFVSQDGDPRYGTFCHQYEELARIAPWVKVWHFGHDHTDGGVYTCRNGAKVISIGALARGALDTDTLTRQVKVAVTTLDGLAVTVQQIALRTEPVDQIFDLPLRQQKAQESRAMAEFVAQLTTGLAGFTADYRAALATLTLEQAVRDKVEGYIAQAESAV
jgi:predicted phosphodiesterase